MTFSYPSGTIIDRIRFENSFFYKGDKSAKKLLIMADQTKIDQFINLTGVDADRARFYIESAGGNVEVFNYPLIARGSMVPRNLMLNVHLYSI